MKRRIIAFMLALAIAAALPGCSFLERGYGSVEPHSSSYYESEAGDVLRAENYQDLVNDLLVLIGDHAAGGTIWLYPGKETLDAEQALEQACQEVQRETPMGSYAVEYMTYTVAEDNRSYREITLSIGYRCTEAQLQAIVHATSVSALHALLTAAADNGAAELVVQLGYFQDQAQEVRDIVAQVEQEKNGDGASSWQVEFYPNETSAGIIEIQMKN
mgnify:FL=1